MTLGDPSGIGPEIVAKAWDLRKAKDLPRFFAIGDSRSIESIWSGPVQRISDPSEAHGVFDVALPCIHVAEATEPIPGKPTLEGARCAFQSLEVGTGLARAESAGALVTAPVSKAQLAAVGFNYPGQTEFVAERCGVARNNAVMMLAGPTLRVVPITIHIPLRAVAENDHDRSHKGASDCYGARAKAPFWHYTPQARDGGT